MTTTLTAPYEIVIEDTSTTPRAEWLAARRLGIGSSDAAGILGLSPSSYSSPSSIYLEKTGQVVPEDIDSERFYWGRAMEPLIIARWAEENGHRIERRHVMLRSIEHPQLLDNPDALTRNAVVEAKTADAWDEDRWDDGVPDHYAFQAIHHMIVTGFRRCYVPVLFGGNHLREFVIDWDPAAAATLIERADEFWRRVVERRAPDPDGSEATLQALRAQFARPDRESVQLPLEAAEIIARRQTAKAAVKDFEAVADTCDALLMSMLGTAEVGLDGDRTLVTWKAQTAHRIDTKALRAEAPDVAEQFTTESTSRVLRIPKTKGV